MDERYIKVSTPPSDALRTIEFGKLKGKSDINPQWRWEIITETYGMCGIGWKYEVTNTITQEVHATGEILLFVFVNLYIKDGDNWSEPIAGVGGDYIIQKDKNGIHGNDEAYKMALTDALGYAAKMIGVASHVYRGFNDGSKYSKQPPQQLAKPSFYQQLLTRAKNGGITENEVKTYLKEELGLSNSKDLTQELLMKAYDWVNTKRAAK